KTKKRHEYALLMDHNKLGKTLSDIDKVIKSEYASLKISDKENDVDHQKKHKRSSSILCINVNEHHKKFDELKNQLSAASNSDDVDNSIWPAWALPNDYDNTKLDSEPDDKAIS
ncbi:8778_t:CDS:2, partial [Cetraspora pellucida]